MSGALREILAVFGTEFDDKGIKDGEKGVGSLKQTLLGFGGILAGAFAVHEIVEFGREVLEQADALAKQSQALSVSAAELQGWQWAAKLSGSSAEEFSSAFTKFNRNVAEASKGTGPAADAFKALGVSIKDSTGKAGEPIDLLDGVADGLAAMQDPGKRTAAVMALFGKSGARLLPLFQEGSEGIKKLRAEVDELGFGFDQAFLEDAQEVNDNVDRLKNGVRGLAIQALKPLLPYITELTKQGVGLVKGLIGILKTSNALKVGLMVFGSVGAVKAVGAMVQLAQKAGFLKNGLRGVVLELLPLIAAFLILEDVYGFFTGADSATGDVLDKLFGEGAADKVKKFADALFSDLGPVLSDVFAIFTDGKPLDEKLKELDNYINSTLKPQFKADFGEMAEAMINIVRLAGDIATAFQKIADTWTTIKDLPKSGIALDFGAQNEQSNIEAQAASGKKAATADDVQAHLDAGPWYARAFASLVGFDPKKAVPQDMRKLAAAPIKETVSNLASAADPTPVQVVSSPARAPAPVVTQSIQAPITQKFYGVESPEAAGKAAGKGAKEGLSEGGEYLRTQRALVPSPG